MNTDGEGSRQALQWSREGLSCCFTYSEKVPCSVSAESCFLWFFTIDTCSFFLSFLLSFFPCCTHHCSNWGPDIFQHLCLAFVPQYRYLFIATVFCLQKEWTYGPNPATHWNVCLTCCPLAWIRLCLCLKLSICLRGLLAQSQSTQLLSEQSRSCHKLQTIYGAHLALVSVGKLPADRPRLLYISPFFEIVWPWTYLSQGS